MMVGLGEKDKNFPQSISVAQEMQVTRRIN